jgi:hypothetical protein
MHNSQVVHGKNSSITRQGECYIVYIAGYMVNASLPFPAGQAIDNHISGAGSGPRNKKTVYLPAGFQHTGQLIKNSFQAEIGSLWFSENIKNICSTEMN